MLPRANRLRRGSEFTLTTRHGSKSSRGRVVAYVHRSGSGPSRVGFVIGRKVGNSVVRHRLARRLRPVLGSMLSTLPEGAWIVVRTLPGAADDANLVIDTQRAVQAAADRAVVRSS